jgi:hypothetical protein
MVVSIPASLVFGFLFKCALVLGAAYLVALWIAKSRGGAAREALRRHGVYLVIFFAAFAIYLGNGRRHLQVDTVPAIYGAISLVETGRFGLTPFDATLEFLWKWVILIKGVDGVTHSQYPPGSMLACVPFAIPLAGSREFTVVDIDFASKRSGALAAALAVVLVFAALRRLGLGVGAWIGTIAYGFGTTLFSTGSQDAWQHAPAALGLGLALYGITRTHPDEPRAAALIGAGLGWAFLSRYTTVACAMVVALYYLVHDRRRFGWLAAGALPFAAFWMYYSWRIYGSPLRTGYDVETRAASIELVGDFPFHLYQTFFNPSRGIFVYSPFLLVGLVGLWVLLREYRRGLPRGEGLAAVGVFSLTAFLVAAIVALYGQWSGGWSYGYRSASECALLLTPPFAVVADRCWRRWSGRFLLVAVLGLSVGIHALEWAFPNDIWNERTELQSWPQILVHGQYAYERVTSAMVRRLWPAGGS